MPIFQWTFLFGVPRACQGLGITAGLTVRNGHPAAPCGTHAAARYEARWRGDAGTLAWVRVVIAEIAWDRSIPRRALNTGSLTEAGRCESLLGQVLAIPPPYRAAPGRPVYVLHAGDRAVVLGEDNLIGSLRQLGDHGPGGRRPMFMPGPGRWREARHGPPDRARDLDGGAARIRQGRPGAWANARPGQPG
jgi:hypothetical protein